MDTFKNQAETETKWFMPWGPNQCEKIQNFDEAMAKKIEANSIVFAAHIPLRNKEMSPWFQFIVAILQFDIAFKMYNQIGKNQNFLNEFIEEGCDKWSCFSSSRLFFQDAYSQKEPQPIFAKAQCDQASF